MDAKKSLGQHWLFDMLSLQAVVEAGEVSTQDTVLEIGPGLGTLTKLLLQKANKVIAVEADPQLIPSLGKLTDPKFQLVQADIRQYDLRQLPPGYKVVANIPYYLTSILIRSLIESPNPPSVMSLLVQKEVAERITAQPGQMSVLALSVQYYAEASLRGAVDKELFEPMPKVDSAILQIKRRSKPYFPADTKKLFRLVKAGFGERRKQLKNSLAGGLRLPEALILENLKKAGIKATARAQELSLDNWKEIYSIFSAHDLL